MHAVYNHPKKSINMANFAPVEVKKVESSCANVIKHDLCETPGQNMDLLSPKLDLKSAETPPESRNETNQ